MYLSTEGVIEALDQLNSGALTTSTWPNKSCSLPCLDLQIKTIQNLSNITSQNGI
jgi:hypothetical protein